MQPVARALAALGLTPKLILTGQHDALDPAEFGLEQYAATRLDCRGEADPHSHVRKVTQAVLPLLVDEPDLILVQGDTSSALGGALAGFAAGLAVAHVEAGLRTGDPSLPWPEEEYRTAIDAKADLLFAPTDLAALNLACDRVPGEVHVTGNTGIDALLEVEARLPAAVRDRAAPRLLVTCHRRESWGAGLASIAAALIALAQRGNVEIRVVLHPNPAVAGAMRDALRGTPGIRLEDPCSHSELVRKMRDSDLILSDSGGIQEEAPALGVPLLVLREKTERPEGIATGNMRLVGTSRDRIVNEVRTLLKDPAELARMARRAFPYGDGHAATRIAEHIDRWLHSRDARQRRIA